MATAQSIRILAVVYVALTWGLCGCADPMSPDQHHKVPRIAVKEAQTRARVERLCAEHTPRLVPVFGGDPRGAVLKIQVPSGRTNDMGLEGVCVP